MAAETYINNTRPHTESAVGGTSGGPVRRPSLMARLSSRLSSSGDGGKELSNEIQPWPSVSIYPNVLFHNTHMQSQTCCGGCRRPSPAWGARARWRCPVRLVRPLGEGASVEFVSSIDDPPLPSTPESPHTAEDEIPANFKKACKGNIDKAGRKWLASRQWREENAIGESVSRGESELAAACGWIDSHIHTSEVDTSNAFVPPN